MWDELKNAREGKGLSQRQLGSETGISPACVSAWENQIPAPFEKLKRLAQTLDTTPNALLGFEVEKAKAKDGEIREGTILSGGPFSKEDLTLLRIILAVFERKSRQELLKGEISELQVKTINDTFYLREKISGLIEKGEK